MAKRHFISNPDDPLRCSLKEVIELRRDDICELLNKVQMRNNRPRDWGQVLDIIERFDLRNFDPISVSHVHETGAFGNYDGQHRLLALHLGYKMYADPAHTFPFQEEYDRFIMRRTKSAAKKAA